MPRFIDDNGKEINSEFSLETISNIQGLIIESWGPKTRNPEYAKAFETLLTRLKSIGLPTIRVFVVSSRLIKAFPNINDREIFLDNKEISLTNRNTEEIRVRIGKEVARLKETNNDSTGGNYYKRILIHSPLVDELTWQRLATSQTDAAMNIIEILTPTSDLDLLERQVSSIQEHLTFIPLGQPFPNKTYTQTEAIERDPLVKAWILQEANGVCELCDSTAPFTKENGKPYLEVHHINHLAKNGSDTITNTIAVCPNCHRALHYSSQREELTDKLYRKIERLQRECN